MSRSATCQCPCGATRFTASASPLFRAFCHCTICQRFNDAPFADITIFRARDVDLPEPGRVLYETLRPPPNVQRGRCVDCEKPAVERMTGIGIPELVIVPTANIDDERFISDPVLHAFYDKRVADIDDDLPKATGYVRSQLAFGRAYLGALRRPTR